MSIFKCETVPCAPWNCLPQLCPRPPIAPHTCSTAPSCGRYEEGPHDVSEADAQDLEGDDDVPGWFTEGGEAFGSDAPELLPK